MIVDPILVLVWSTSVATRKGVYKVEGPGLVDSFTSTVILYSQDAVQDTFRWVDSLVTKSKLDSLTKPAYIAALSMVLFVQPCLSAPVDPEPETCCEPVGAGYVFSCYGGSKTSYCRSAPYNYRCDVDGNKGYDSPDSYCGDETKCDCDLVH